MSRPMGYVLGAAILVGSAGIAYLMISLRPIPVLREAPSQVPFAITEPAVAGAGAIPVHGLARYGRALRSRWRPRSAAASSG